VPADQTKLLMERWGDEVLMGMLRELRKKVAKKLGVPPFVVVILAIPL